MKRLLGVVTILALGCVSPSRARYLGGGYASVEDSRDIEGACRARVAGAQLAPVPRLELAVPTTAVSTAPSAPAPGATVTAGASGQASYVVDGGALGQLRVDVRGALGLRADAVVEAPAPPVPFAQMTAAPPAPVRGFLFGIDLRIYRKIVFIVDASGSMCTAPYSGQRLPIDRAADHLVAALTGLPPDTDITMMSTAASVRMLHPLAGDDARRAAMQWTCNLFCIADTSLSVALLDAFSERPDVVVVLSTNGGAPMSGQSASTLDRDLQLSFTDPEKVLERVSGAVPVIAVDLGPGSSHLAAIAQQTGGVVVRP